MDPAPNKAPVALSDPVTPQDHSLGSPTAPITIVEYGDYECPSCLNFVPIIREIREKLGGKLQFVFRHFPRSSIHPHASAAAQAAEAAADQGKFWEMHEELFRRQKELADIDLSHVALTLGLEIYRFETSYTQDKHRQRIKADYESGLRHGIIKTPTLFINGFKYDGPITTPAILTVAESAAAQS